MKTLIVRNDKALQTSQTTLPALIADAGEQAQNRTYEFFAATIRNKNTRLAYMRAVQLFAWWCEDRKISLEQLTPVIVAAYIEQLGTEVSAPTVKQHLSGIRMLFDYLVTGQVLPANPATAVKAPKHVVTVGKTPVLTAAQTRQLLDSIKTTKIAGLRDRAIIGVMVFSFARVSAVLKMNVQDYFLQGRRSWFRLNEKGGKPHAVPAHHNAEAYVDAYIAAAGIGEQKKSPLFRTINSKGELTENRLDRRNVWAMLKRRAKTAKLGTEICCHTFRATGITAYLKNGGTLEIAQHIAAHATPQATKLYDRRNEEISLSEVERIVI